MSKSNHFSTKSVFGQLISLIDDSLIKKDVKKCESDRYTKRFKTKDHLISMLFCSFSKWKSGERCEMRGASISITKFTEIVWNDGVFEVSKEHLDVIGSALVFQFMYVEKNLFYYKEILHFATLRSEWQSFGL